jgi:uncharacterized protein YdeI (YjbR/CyaY-like superfamily)
MPAPKPSPKTLKTKTSKEKTFEAVLERMPDRLRWVIARVPFDAAKLWGKRGQIRVQGELNSFAFATTLFPDGQGGHFLLVNKKMLRGGKASPGQTVKFHLQPDTTLRVASSPPDELLRELKQSKRLLKFFDSLNPSRRNEIAKWIAEPKSEDARRRRAQQIAERLMETMEAERELPPIMQLAFRQNPRACAEWNRMSPSHRRAHLFAVFYYRTPEARANRVAKMIKEMLGRKPERGNEEDRSETF